MELDAFIRERRPRWDRFERLLNDAEQGGDRDLDSKSIHELVTLYRQACSDLNQARSITAQPMLLDRLNELTGRGYRYVYRDARRITLRQATTDLFLYEIPATFRREWSVVVSATVAMSLGILFGFAGAMFNPSLVEDLVPGQFQHESAKNWVHSLEKSDERINTIQTAAAFATHLMSHNIQISFLAFSLGALTILGGYWILFYNGVMVGALAAQFVQDGVATFFLAWVGPHGALELPAIIFSGAAGIKAGRALLLPGDLSVASSVRRAFPDLRRMLLGTAALLVLAGLIEGSFSQFTNRTFPYPLKIGVAVMLFTLLVSYLFVRRAGKAAEASG